MTMTTTNVEILRQGWLDAASALAPGLEKLPEFLEKGLDAAVVDERLDEQSLLRVVADVTSAAADSLPADELYFLTRRLQRAVYEYLLSLDALPEPPPRRDGANGHGAPDTTLIGAEEVAALGRTSIPRPRVDPATDVLHTIARPHPDPAPNQASIDTIEAGLAELDAQLGGADEEADTAEAEPEPEPEAHLPETEAATAAEAEPAAAPSPAPSTRPAFTLFRRTGAKDTQPAAGANGHAPSGEDAIETSEPVTAAGDTPRQAAAPSATGSGTHAEPSSDDDEPFVAPRDGFHLSDLADFTEVQRGAKHAAAAEVAPDADPVFEAIDAAPQTDAPQVIASEAIPTDMAAPEVATEEAPSGAGARGWRLRDDEPDLSQDLSAERSVDDDRFETDPEVVEARLEINDRLRRKRCDEAAALLQRLANDVGGRALAELALDAGDRCRALGKGNAALSCYLAGSRADPVHETPLLRLADICIDDHDIDLAVSYLERVTRLRRLRGDDKGALKLYRKIVTIAPYRDDILAMLMRAQANGRFDE
jgi:hypothetical protein